MKDEREIIKWLNGELSIQEIEDLKKSEGFETIEKIAHYASHMQAPEVNAQEALNAFKRRNLTKKETKVIPLNFKSFFKVAAAIAVVLTSAYFLFYNSNTTFETQIAQTKNFNLPDQSEVLLNAGSKITFNKKKWSKNRDVKLEGEAYFQVKKGQTFAVKTTDGLVQVLGTHFNVKQRDNYYEVSCYEGLVSVTYNNETVKLPPGNTFRVVNNKVEKIEELNTDGPSWLQHESYFDRVPLNQVIAELQLYYDIKIKTENVDTTKLFTGSFTHKNQLIALESVTIPLQLSYRIDGKNITFYNYGDK